MSPSFWQLSWFRSRDHTPVEINWRWIAHVYSHSRAISRNAHTRKRIRQTFKIYTLYYEVLGRAAARLPATAEPRLMLIIHARIIDQTARHTCSRRMSMNRQRLTAGPRARARIVTRIPACGGMAFDVLLEPSESSYTNIITCEQYVWSEVRDQRAAVLQRNYHFPGWLWDTELLSKQKLWKHRWSTNYLS